MEHCGCESMLHGNKYNKLSVSIYNIIMDDGDHTNFFILKKLNIQPTNAKCN